MFKYEEEKKEQYRGIGRSEINEIKIIALNTPYEEEMFELTKTENPFVMRELAKNKYLTKKVAIYLIEEHCAYTMLVNLAKNDVVNEEIKNKLYIIATEGEYKNSKLKEDLDNIFSKKFIPQKMKLKNYI